MIGRTMQVSGTHYSPGQMEFIETAYANARNFYDFHRAFSVAPFWIGEDDIDALWDHMSSHHY